MTKKVINLTTRLRLALSSYTVQLYNSQWLNQEKQSYSKQCYNKTNASKILCYLYSTCAFRQWRPLLNSRQQTLLLNLRTQFVVIFISVKKNVWRKNYTQQRTNKHLPQISSKYQPVWSLSKLFFVVSLQLFSIFVSDKRKALSKLEQNKAYRCWVSFLLQPLPPSRHHPKKMFSHKM